MDATTIGLVAGALTSFAAVPQVLRTWRTRQARDLSIWQPVILTVGMFLWLAYGMLLKDLPLIVANLFSIVCYLVLIGMKIIFDRADKLALRD
ncbi:SemiSWEET family sugar transporter [Geobacter argillaceus]|uniref:MtN3 and saliva related transmembrane protein n=1 Tax=Geobacter argillaceus TaxID=345631 RepID=A0A562W9Q4_9BACT|nr:SemiSWEET transporter [Geobacter argillaceus]TWJ26414.1 MtN3 and saliva related transmembrane protein [Geobacter argillaceus]